MSEAAVGPVTVRLNVGGTKYEVVKSLFELYPDTMLARLVSERWQQDPSQEIFVDRDGVAFKYVISYMRDHMAHLAIGVSKGSVLKELEYFGFQDIPEGAIEVECGSFEAAKRVVMLKEGHKTTLREMDAAKDFEIVAYTCFDKYCQGGVLTVSIDDESDKDIYNIINKRLWPRKKKTIVAIGNDKRKSKVVADRETLQGLNARLVKYGLRCISCHRELGKKIEAEGQLRWTNCFKVWMDGVHE